MAIVESFFVKHTSYPSQEIFASLAATVQVEGSNTGSPVPVKCTKKLYNNLVNHVDSAVSLKQYDNFCIILSALRYIVKGSTTSASGFPKLLSFGLAKKISQYSLVHHSTVVTQFLWCMDMCLPEHKECQMAGWSKAADDMLFTVTVVINFSEDSKQAMIPLLPALLQCISSPVLPGSAKIEATRGSNILLEVCGLKYKSNLIKREDIKALILKMDELVRKAGDFELQITTLECLFRLTTVAERGTLANKWYKAHHHPSLLKAFSSIRESFFEVDCRKFLNVLNRTCGKDRTVYSIPCKRAFLGTFELHQPRDEGLDEFWVDFNMATSNMSLYTEDMCNPGGEQEGDDMWESIIVKNDIVKEWSVTNADKMLSLSVTLSVPTHNLLHFLPAPTPSHEIFITFEPDSDPTYPLQQVFGSSKQAPPPKQAPPATSNQEKVRSVKQSVAIAPILLNPKFKGLKDVDNISPIEPTQDSPVGKHVNSQDSATPPNHSIPPITTPATSTPKPHPLRGHGAPPPSSSSSGRCPPLQFVSSGSGKPKASQSVSGIVLGKNSRVVQRNTPNNSLGNVGGAPTPPARQRGSSMKTNQKNGGVQASAAVKPASEQRAVATVDSKKQELKSDHKTPVSNTGGPATKQAPDSSRQGSKESSRSKSQASASVKAAAKQSRPVSAAQQIKPTATSTQSGKQARGLSTASSGSTSVQGGTPQHPQPKSTEKPKSLNSGAESVQKERGNQPKPRALKTKPDTKSQAKADPKSESVSALKGKKKATSQSTQQPPQSTAPTTRSARKSKADVQKPTSSRDSAVQQKAPQAKKTSPAVSTVYDSVIEVVDLEVSLSEHQPPVRTFPRKTYNQPLKSSPPSKKQLNSSFSSNASAASRTALADISNLCLNRGGQKRVFNFSAVQRPKGKKRKNQKVKSNCTSLNTTANSEQELTAIPDSLPLNPTQQQRNAGKATNRAPKKRQNKQVCVPTKDDSLPESDVYDYDESLEDSSWDMSPPKAKKPKKAPARQKDRECKSKANPPKKTAKSKVILTSARTKKPPASLLSSFDLTVSDFDQDEFKVPKAKVPHYKSRGNTINESSITFTELKKRGKKTNPSKDVPAKQTALRRELAVPNSPDSLPGGDWNSPPSTSPASPPQRTTRKRLIDDIYNVQVSPQPPSPQVNIDVIQKPPEVLDTSPDLPLARGRAHKTSSKKQLSAKKSAKQPTTTPHSRRASLGGDNVPRGQARRSNPAVNFTARALLKEFEEDEVEEEDDDGEQIEKASPPNSIVRSKDSTIKEILPQVPKKQQSERQSRRSSGYYSTQYISYQSDSANNSASEDKRSRSRSPLHGSTTTTRAPSCPAPSLRPSQEEADKDITKGFAEICQNLIAQSGKKPERKSESMPSKGARNSDSMLSKGARNSDSMLSKGARLMKSVEKGQRKEVDVPVNVTLTQLSRDMVSKHSTGGRERGVQPEWQYRSKSGARVLEDVDISRESDIELESNSSASSDEDAMETLRDHDTVICGAEHYSSEEEEEEESSVTNEEIKSRSIGAEMQALMTTIRDSLTSARKQRIQKKASGSVLKRVPEELRELWQAHIVERETVLQAYQQQLGVELQRLEKEMLRTTTSENEVTSFLRKKIKELTKSREFQQSQLCRLHGLQQAFHEQLHVLEDSQSQQQVTSQEALKKDMYNLRKKILVENQKQEVDRIKRSLQAMLMQV